MSDAVSAWAATELAEFVARLSLLEDPRAVVQEAVDGVAEALDAEVAALVVDGRVHGVIGWPRGQEPQEEILAVAAAIDQDPHLEVPGAGSTPVVAAPVDRAGGVILVARVGEPIGAVERGLLSAMGRTARMALDSATLFARERQAREAAQELADQRQRLLEDMQRVNAAKDDFLSMASHELRTPLTSIVGFVETLRQRPDLDAADRDRALVVIERQAHRLRRLVANLLDLSTIEAGGAAADPQVVSVARVLEDLGTERLTHEPDDLVLDLPEDVVAVVDSAQLRQVVVNLVSNAVKYGQAPIEVSTARVGEQVEVCVRDHGPGVPADFRDRLFDKFSQASTGTLRSASGAGLGLAISRGLARANDGDLRHEEPADGGARFVVVLPAGPPSRVPD